MQLTEITHELKRREIPVLKVHAARKGALSISARNFTYGEELIRIYQGETLLLRVQFGAEAPDLAVVLSSNLSGDWSDYAFSRTGELEFSLELKCARAGVFQFKVKYSHNHGKTWVWDSIPFSSVLVDPSGMKNLRLYTLIPTRSGHIGNWIAELHRIKKLGFNAVHLLPVTTLDASESPYSAADLFDLDASYAIPGDPRPLLDQMESFVKEAKTLDLKLCFDLVLNHVGVTSKISVDNRDWIASDTNEADGLKRAGCWEGTNWLSWRDIVLIKYDHPDRKVRKEIWDYMSEYLLFWANYASYTGGLIRLDNLHSSHRDFLSFALGRLRQEYPDLTVFAEFFTDPQTTLRMVFHHELNLLLATPWISPFVPQFRQFLSTLHANPKIRYLLPVSSHDSGTPAQEYGSPDAVVPRYAACLLLGGGQTGFVQGAEFGAPRKLEFIGRQSPSSPHPITRENWGQDYSECIRRIHDYVDQNALFSEIGNIQFVDSEHGAVLGALRTSQDRKKTVLILISFDTQAAHELAIALDPAAFNATRLTLRDCLDPEQQACWAWDSASTIRLDPCEVKVFEVEP